MNNNLLNLHIGRALKFIRESRNYKQEYIAEKIGYADKSTYAKIEGGKLKHLSIGKLNEACEAMNCSIIHLMLLAAHDKISYKTTTWEQFIDSLNEIPEADRNRITNLVEELFPEKLILLNHSSAT